MTRRDPVDPMRILFVSQYFYPEQFSNNAIAQTLAARGHEVHAIPCVPNYPEGVFRDGYSHRLRREEIWEGVHVHRVRTVARGKSKLRLALNYLAYPLAGLWTALRRVSGRADVSFASLPSPLTQALTAIFYRWVRGTPVVIWVQDIWPESVTITLGIRNRFVVRVMEALCGWIYRRADLVLVQSMAFPPMITRFGVPEDRIRFFPNTAAAFYRPVRPEDAPDQGALVPQDGFRLMFAGNIGDSQDFGTLIAAADLLRTRAGLKWVIIGSGRGMEAAEAEIARRGLTDRFHFLGRHPEETMPGFFAHADAMLVSLKDTDIFRLTVPYKTTCYMACGKPIIASLTGEGARIIEQAGAGIAAPASSPDALAGAIERMMDLPAPERAALGHNARRYFEANYQPDQIMDNLETWLADTARHRDTRRGH